MRKILFVMLAMLALMISVVTVMASEDQIQTRSGTAIVVDTQYFLDTDGDGDADIHLDFGPPGYDPLSGAVRPSDGDTITVTGKLTGEGTPDAEMDVYEIGVYWWRNPGKPDWAKGPPAWAKGPK